MRSAGSRASGSCASSWQQHFAGKKGERMSEKDAATYTTSLPNGIQSRQADIVRAVVSVLVHVRVCIGFACSVGHGVAFAFGVCSIHIKRASMGRFATGSIHQPPSNGWGTCVYVQLLKRMFLVRRERETVRSRWVLDLLSKVARNDNETPPPWARAVRATQLVAHDGTYWWLQ